MINGLSLFANVGIAETYLKDVGVNIVVANELLKERADFYRHVYPDCLMINGDITDKNVFNSVVKESLNRNVEFIMATPPCQGMSLAGHKDPNDVRNFLITYALDIFKLIKPKYILIENVVQQLSTSVTYKGKKVLIPDMIESELGLDYVINENHIMNTEKLGVPQKRVRALFLLVRKDLKRKWEIPEWDGNIKTVRDAIGDLPSLDPYVKEEEYRWHFPDYEKKKQEGLKISKWHYARPHVWRNVEVMLHTPSGCSAKKNPVYYPKNKEGKLTGGSGSTYMRMDWDKPAPTVTTYNHTISSFQNVHPGKLDKKTGLYSDPRVLTVFELMRITTLPDDWNIPDWASESLVRTVIGEGIPPLAIKKVVGVLKLGDAKMINGLSLFSNVGVAETYLEEVGIDIVVANELISERAKFYSHLYPKCEMICGDITNEYIFNSIVEKAKTKKVEFIMATPPCQGMSIAGLMDPHDERNSLVKYAIDIIEIIKPKYVLLENVIQQLTTPIKYGNEEIKIPEYIQRRIGHIYNFNNDKIINAADYGVPQRRERAIILMTRKDLGYTWEFPEKDDKRINLEEAFCGIPDLWPIIREKEYQNILPKNTEAALTFHKWHKPPRQCWRNTLCMLYTPTGNTAFDNVYYYPRKKDGTKIKGYDTTYHRMFWDKPAPTITRYNGVVGSQNNVHPGRPWKKDKNGDQMYTNPRVLSIYELMVASSLPVDWNIPDWASDELIRHVIGEGIPPLLIKRIIENIRR